jgi:O-antigen/teichoic acid export membrane protein
MSFAKKVVGGTAVITLSGIGSRLLSFITVPILTPLLGPEPYGLAALVGTAVSIGGILGLLGIDMAYARYFLGESQEHRFPVERFCWRFAAAESLFSSLVIALIWLGWGGRLAHGSTWLPLYCAGAIFFSSTVIMATTRIRLQGGYNMVAVGQLGAALISAAISIAIALFWRRDVWALLLGVIGGSLANMAILGLPSAGSWLKPARLDKQMRLKILNLGLAGSVTAPMYWVITSADRWFISAWRNTSEVGVYSVAVSLGMIGAMLNSSLTLTWFPEISRLYGEQGKDALPNIGRLWERMVAGLAIVWVAIAASGGDVLRLLASQKFHSGAALIPWIAGGVFFYGVSSMSNTSLFLGDKMKYAAVSWTAGGGVNLILNMILVPKFGTFGAAMVNCVTFVLISIITLFIAQKTMSIPISGRRIFLVAALSLLAGSLMSAQWSKVPLESIAYKVPFGILYMAVIVRWAAPDWFSMSLRQCRKVLERI